jgi:hypothetical protein
MPQRISTTGVGETLSVAVGGRTLVAAGGGEPLAVAGGGGASESGGASEVSHLALPCSQKLIDKKPTANSAAFFNRILQSASMATDDRKGQQAPLDALS